MNERGYSAVELVMAVGITIMMAAITYPSIVASMDLLRLETSVAMIEGKLGDARINAIKRNRQVWLKFDSAQKSVQVQYDDGGTVDVGPEGYLGTGISFASPTPTQLTFDAQGWPTVAPETARLEIDRTGDQKDITVSLTGKVTISTP